VSFRTRDRLSLVAEILVMLMIAAAFLFAAYRVADRIHDNALDASVAQMRQYMEIIANGDQIREGADNYYDLSGEELTRLFPSYGSYFESNSISSRELNLTTPDSQP